MNWDWEKLQEKRQRQSRTPSSQNEGPENPFKGFQLGGMLPKLFGRGFPYGTAGVIVLLLWLASGIFIVKPGEVGVITRFGKYDRQVTEGPHYRLPFPLERAEIVVAQPLRTVVIGQGGGGSKVVRGAQEEASMFTGDENIVHMRFNVQYNINDPRKYLFEVKEPERTIRIASEAAMREVVGRSNIDSILTSGRAEIQVAALQVLERILDNYKLGVKVHTVQLLDVQPPPEVGDSFKNVASAREDRERIINEAEAYRMEIVPVAQGTAQSMVNGAKAYERQVEQAAEGEAQRFLAMASEFAKAQDITKKRLYLEAMSELLSSPGVQKIIINKDASQSILPLLTLDPSLRSTQRTNAGEGVQ